MAETGWPLIPRELLPAPVRAARPARRQSSPGDGGRQLSIFGAETTEPSPGDLAGLLAGPGRLDRMGGTARVSVRVDAAWRVHVLVGELVSRGLVVSWLPIDEEAPADPAVAEPEAATETTEGSGTSFEVRTAYSSRLIGLARSWPPPSDRLFLSGPRLRLWAAAAGEPRPGAYSLALNPGLDQDLVDAALSRAGLAGMVSDAGRHYLISGRKCLARLAELVGERPAAVPAGLWPGGAPV
jgi:hypothetical protein